MSCTWKEEQAYRFAEGTLEQQSRQAFAGHLDHCAVCRDRVSEAESLEVLMRSTITSVPAPATLAGRVANAVAAEGGRRPRFAWPLLFSGRRFAPALVGLTLVVVLGLLTFAMAPAAVMAVVQRALFFIPGVGISAVEEGHLVAAGPVVVRDGGVIFTVEALLSDGQSTRVEFSVAGLPGGKRGMDSREGPSPRRPTLRDETGREYGITSAHHGVGGSPEENRITGGIYFAPLPGNLRSVELVVPADYLVPEAMLPGAASREWVARIPLVPPTQSGLPRATPQTATAASRGVTLRVVASTLGREHTVLLLEGQAEGAARPQAVGKMGRDPADAAILRDDRGRVYRLIPQQSIVTFGDAPFSQDLYFPPLAAGARELTLEVAALRVREEGSASFTVPLAGRQPDDSFALDRTVQLGSHQVRLETARVVERYGKWWLFIEVDLGPTVEGRTLAAFTLEGARSWGQSFGKDEGAQLSEFSVEIDPGATEVEIRLGFPVVNVEGPWKMSLPVGGSQQEAGR